MIRIVRPISLRPEDDRERVAACVRAVRWRAVHVSGSRTLRRIQIVKSAGSTPARNSQRQPSSPSAGGPRMQRRQHRRHDVAERPARLHDADRLVAQRRRPRLADQHGARRPLAAHADAEQRAPEHQLQDALRRRRAERGEREQRDRPHQRAGAAEPVGDVAERQAADRRTSPASPSPAVPRSRRRSRSRCAAG